MKELQEVIAAEGIAVIGSTWKYKDSTFTSNRLYTVLSHHYKCEYSKDIKVRGAEQVLEALSEGSQGKVILSRYIELLKDFELPEGADIVESNDEYVLAYDGSDKPNKCWYSRSIDNLIEIAYEIELKKENR